MIPFSPPTLTEDDIEAVVSVLRSGWITTGPVGREFEAALTAYTGCAGTVTLSSATAALELALRLCDVGPGDEVIVPAYTYTATAAVVHHVGASIVVVDTEPGSCTPSPERVLAAVSPRTKAVITVDLAGVPFDTRPLAEALTGQGSRAGGLQQRLDRPVLIADAAHSLGARLDHAAVGEVADLTAFSFHAVKNLTTAEGGALQWRTGLPADHDDIERSLRLLSLHGQSKDALAKTTGTSWEYDIEVLGWKANMPDVLAALGLSQLARYDSIVERRLEMVSLYQEGLSDTGITLLPHQQPGLRSSAHLAIATLPVPGVEERNAFIDQMRHCGVATNVHYKPLPMLTAYKRLGLDISRYPHAASFYATEVTLPLHMALTDDDIARVCHAARTALPGSR
ncbi:DegT/DnrJ/EryC1/StrS aminotransferase family protein [Actinomyces lilanjuaniae]|uniref:DegT/DnrJ/EryC1/StrS aminotransferase family protein n=1 Tax=Actinomyces lilanjuaniae TaxID=2321394 RepID=A0ABM6Z4U7_9ACTO|nr:DegT/DnrJ/EryC1/StrS aminotransferase family protein [Actinomyces lilanjuaniae]AYD90106.1 DegT/DnrJ/EryC1/StrS aminotransferase family protein [Actinomyces lilanjuaniae]